MRPSVDAGFGHLKAVCDVLVKASYPVLYLACGLCAFKGLAEAICHLFALEHTSETVERVTRISLRSVSINTGLAIIRQMRRI
jgi:hypothetical protein